MCRERDILTGRQGADRRPPPDVSVVDSVNLFAGRKEVEIRHAGEVYRLRITRNGKLILNK